jgi:hypothetical protein
VAIFPGAWSNWTCGHSVEAWSRDCTQDNHPDRRTVLPRGKRDRHSDEAEQDTLMSWLRLIKAHPLQSVLSTTPSRLRAIHHRPY